MGKIARATSVIAIFLGLTASVQADEVLRITSWGGATQDAERNAYWTPYSEQTGVKIVEDEWNGDLGKIRAMVESGSPSWDIVVADYAHAITGCDDGILEPIDMSKISNPSDFIPGTLHECGVPTYVFAVIFAYDADNIPASWGDARPQTVGDMFDTEKFPGKRALRKDPKWMLEPVLMADGVPADQVYAVLSTPEGLERAFAKLDGIKSSVVWWDAGAQPPQLLADGEVSIAQMYSSRFYDARMNEKKNFVPVWDGQVYSANSLIIPKGADKDEAMKFLAYVTDPERVAQITHFTSYGPARISADQYVSDDIKPYLPTAPENLKNALLSGEQWWADHYDEINEKFQVWLAK